MSTTIVPKLRTVVCALACLTATAAFQPSLAQPAAERAGQLKDWRNACTDPDPDLQLAYLEAAIATGDTAIIRICVREALESDNADILNLGLRAALASAPRITFQTSIPPELKKEYDNAGKDKEKLNQISHYYINGTWLDLRPGLTFEVTDAKIESSTATWTSLVDSNKPDERNKGISRITGTRVTWQGQVAAGRTWTCILDAELVAGQKLQGELSCPKQWAIPVSLKLL